MNYRKLLSNVAAAFASQGVSMLASILTSLLVPKLLGVEEFGYWQLFIFYTSYVGFFHLGICDGVYLINGGLARESIDKRYINSQFWFSLAYQLGFSVLIVFLSQFIASDSNRGFVLYSTAVFLLLNNASIFVGYVFQSMNETKLYSLSVMLDRGVFAALLVLLLIFRIDQFEVYVCAYAIGKIACLAFSLFRFRDFVSSGIMNLEQTAKAAAESIHVGSKLMVANLADMLILGIARALIDANWGIEIFGQVSLALSLMSFFVTFMTQFSMVLYPALRQTSHDEQASMYRSLRLFLDVALPVVYLGYYPLAFLLELWLPAYSLSMFYLGLLLPICVFNSAMSICATTYLKVLRRERDILVLNAVSVAASAVVAGVGAYLLSSVEFILIGSACIVATRYLAALVLLGGDFDWGKKSSDVWLFGLSGAFFVSYIAFDTQVAFTLYVALYIVFVTVNRALAKDLVDALAKVMGRTK